MTITTFGRWGEPAFVGVYSPPGTGKTTDATLFDPMGWSLAMPGALKSAEWHLGPLYDTVRQMVIPVATFEDVVGVVERVATGQIEARTVRVDDLSVVMKTTVARLGEKYPKSHNFAKWDELAALADRFKQACRKIPAHTIAGCHLAYPKTDEKGKFHLGGPDMGGPQAMAIIVAVMDVLYKGEADTGSFPHPAVYRQDAPHPQWSYKDRHNVVLGVGPMNLREIFRVAGLAPARYPGMEWLDTVADDVAADLERGTAKMDVWKHAVPKLVERGAYIGHACWGVRDGFARYDLATSRRLDPYTRALATAGAGSIAGASGPPVLTLPTMPTK